MKRLTNMSVGRKLAVMLTTTTTVALLLMVAAFISYDRSSSKRDAVEQLTTIGKIVAGNSNAAVAFDDAKAAADVLNALEQEPDILNGCTYGLSQNLLAQYHRQPVDVCPHLAANRTGVASTLAGAASVQVILLNDAPVGYVYLESNLAGMRARRNRFTLIALVCLLASLGAATVLGALLQRWITRPLGELASVMLEVTESRDYSLRAESHEDDEIGRLVTGFNLMLSEIQSSQGKLESQALTDELTGLPNRRLFAEKLKQALAHASRNQDLVALIYLDLDGFKLVNDTLGHSVGDLLLREVAARLFGRVRASDTLARLGGDEFTVVAGEIRSVEQAKMLAKDLLAQFVTPFSISGHDLSLTASLGISFYPQDALNAEQLIRRADTAMYVAKSTGKNKFTFFAVEHGDAVQERMQLETQLRSAIERKELRVHYQPEFETLSHQLVRFEALARWIHPTLGTIPPLKFIPIAEETGLIVPMGLWVLEQACIEARTWQAPSRAPVQVAVNVSIVQLMQGDFVDSVVDILDRTGLLPEHLQLELTESVLLPRFSECSKNISQLRLLGIGVAIDDFGTGYSSLSYLQQMPIDSIKIDRSFLVQITREGHSLATIRSIVDLAHALEMRVIVEGVETLNDLQLVEELGCDEIQGYLMGRPTADPSPYLAKEDLRSDALCSDEAATLDTGFTEQPTEPSYDAVLRTV